MDWNAMWESIKNFFTNNGWNIVKFFAVLVIGIILIKLILNLSRKVLGKTKVPKMTYQFILLLVKVLLYLFLVLILLSIMGIQISGILTAFSAIILAVGVALENNISNFANGIILVSTQMFNAGDYISIQDDVEGTIVSINFLFTTINTTDNKKITVPNSKLVNNSVSNYSAYSTRRVNMNFAVSYDSDVEKVKKIITDVMKSNGKVYLDKPIFCRLKSLEDSNLNFYGYCWCDTSDYWDVFYYLQENVYNEFKRNGIDIAYNQVEVRNRTDTPPVYVDGDKLPERIEKVREEKESDFDLETADLTKIFNPNTYKKKHKKKKSNKNKNTKSAEVSVSQTTNVNATVEKQTNVNVTVSNEKKDENSKLETDNSQANVESKNGDKKN